MPDSLLTDPFHRAKVLAMLLKIADPNGNVDLDNAEQLWALGVRGEDLLELAQQGAIHFESVGEDGFKSIDICSVGPSTHNHLQESLSSATEQNLALNARIVDILKHDPDKLRKEITQSEIHIRIARDQIKRNPILQPMGEPLNDIARHFSSISSVARNYDDVYKNILKPMQDEARKGIRATVFWAVMGILAAWLLSNYSKLAELLAHAS